MQLSSPHDTWGSQVLFTAHTAVFTIIIEVEQMHAYVNWDEVELIMTTSSGSSGDPEQLAKIIHYEPWFVSCGMYKQLQLVS